MASSSQPPRSRRRPREGGDAEGSAPRRARVESQAQDAPYVRVENRLHAVLERKQIECKHTLTELIHKCPADKQILLMEKSAHFFTHVDRAQIADTSVLTSMLFGGSRTQRALIAKIDSFISSENSFITLVASSRCLKPIAAMHHGVGFPICADTQNFLSLSLLETYGMSVVRALSSMCTGKRFPSSEAVNELLAGAVRQADGNIDQSVLRSIAHMCHGRGVPANTAVASLLSLPSLQERGDLNSFALHKIAAMCSGGGLPNQTSVDTIMALTQQHSGNELDLQRQLLRCFADLYHRRGVPTAGEINRVLGLADLSVGGQLDIALLEAVARANKGACIPRPDMIEQARRTRARLGSVAGASAETVATPRGTPLTSQRSSHSGSELQSLLSPSRYLRNQGRTAAPLPVTPADANQGTSSHSSVQPSTSTSRGPHQAASGQMFDLDFSSEDALEQAQDAVTSINIALLGALADSAASTSTVPGPTAQPPGLLSLDDEFDLISEMMTDDGFDEADNH